MSDIAVEEPLWVIEIRPGHVLTDPEWKIMVREACMGYDLQPDEVLCTPYGYAPMPRPPAPQDNGMGRVPQDVRYDVALHPVYWMHPVDQRRRKGEDDDVYAVRLAVSLTELNMIDPSTQEPQNPFLAEGIDTDHPEVREDIADFQMGVQVGWLQEFVVGPLPPDRRDQIDRVVAKLVDRHRSDYYKVKDQAGERLDQFVAGAVKFVSGADLKTYAHGVLSVGDRLLKDPSNRQLRHEMTRAVNDLSLTIDKIDSAAATMRRVMEVKGHGRPQTPLRDVHRNLDQRAASRREHIERQVAIATVKPSQETMRQLWHSVKATWEQVYEEANTTRAQFEALI